VAKDLFSKQKIERFLIDTEILFIAAKRKYTIKQIPAELLDKHTYKNSKVKILVQLK
jgi:hypothetical protein